MPKNHTYPTVMVIAITLLLIGSSCHVLPEKTSPAQTTPAETQPPGIEPTSANGWKLSKDASGVCQVTTPPDWQLGSDFFLAADKAAPGSFSNAPGQFPPIGKDLWKTDTAKQSEGTQYQVRKSLVTGERVCSVWRIKAGTDFTTDEKSLFEQVGKTLKAAQ